MRNLLSNGLCVHLVHHPDWTAAGICCDCGVECCDKCIQSCSGIGVEASVITVEDVPPMLVVAMQKRCGQMVCGACRAEHKYRLQERKQPQSAGAEKKAGAA